MIELIEAPVDVAIDTVINSGIKEVNVLYGIKKPNLKKNVSNCPYCNQISLLIWVHGHYQCQKCKSIVVSCCEAG